MLYLRVVFFINIIAKIYKKIRSLIIFSAIVLLFLGAGVVIKNIFLNQIKKNIEASFYYDHLHMSFFPPLLIVEDVRTRTFTPFFTAEKISMSISYKSLLTRQRPFQVKIEHPVLKISESSARDETEAKGQFELSFPLLVEEGLIKDGEFYFQGKEVSFQSRGVNAVFIQKRNEFSLEADAEENVFFPGSSRPALEGKVSVSIESRGQKIHVKKLKIDSEDFWVESEGSLVNPQDPEFNLATSFGARVPLVIEFLHLPFEWKGDTEGKGILTRTDEGISFQAGFASNNLFLNNVDMGEVSGRIDYSDRSGQTVEFNCRRGSMPLEYVKVHFVGKEVEGTVKGAFLDPVLKYFSLPLPIASPAWGSFHLNEEKLEADIEFKDEYYRDKLGQYPFRGPLKLNWDLKKKVTVSSPSLSSSFGEFDLEGTFNVGQDLDITIQGEVKDLKRAREFTSILLSRNYAFPEIRGKGEADLHIFGDYYVPQVQARFSLSPGGFGRFEVASVDGEAEIIKGDFFGRFNLDDVDMKGRIGLLSSQEGVKADIRLEQGLVERILHALNIDLPLQGKAQGSFEFSQKEEDIQVRGDFAGELLNFVGQDLKEVSGKLEWRENVLSLSDLQFHLHRGVMKGSTTLGLLNQEFDIHIQGEDIDLSSLYSGVTGKLRFLLDGKGIFGKDFALGPFEIKNLYHSPFQRTEARGLARFSHSQGKLGLDLIGNFSPGDNEFNISFLIPTLEDELSVGIRGNFTNLDLLLPWKGVQGRVHYIGEVKGPKASPQVKGAVDFNGSIFPWPGFAHAFRDYSGLMFVDNNKLTFRSLRAELGGGEVQGSGELLISDGGVDVIHAKLEGKNMLLSPLERTRTLADGTLSLIKEPGRFVLEGNIYAHKLSWRREINEEVVFYSRPYYEMEKEPGFFDDLTLNIRLRADDDAWMENSLGRIRGRFDLNVTGSVSEPVITGEIEGLGGDVNFQDRKFKLLVGRVNFINPTSTKPYLSFKGETHVKDYRVTFSLDGLLDHLNPEFTSSPPLPPEDVLALLALGEAFRRTYSYDTSTRLSTASLISFQLSEEAKKRAEGLFTIDRFRIDPFVMGSSAEMSARLTVGKKISRNFFILYSTNLTTQREEIARLEWELTDDISVVGTRDEEGRISFDVKIYKRF
jgi:hypothetical protein